MSTKPLVIIGSGLAATTVAQALLKKGNELVLITSSVVKDSANKTGKSTSVRIKQEQEAHVLDFIERGKIDLKNFEAIGSNEIGGLSNFWGGGFILSNRYLKRWKINIHTKKLQQKVYFSLSSTKLGKHIGESVKKTKSISGIEFFPSNILKDLNTGDRIISARKDFFNLEKDNNISIYKNSLVTKIKKNTRNTFDIFVNNSQKKLLTAKKIVFAAGCINSTKLLLEYLGAEERKIRLYHNPHLAILGILRNGSLDRNKVIKSDLMYLSKSRNMPEVAGSIGTLSDDIIERICRQFWIIPSFFIRAFLKILRNRVYVANCFIDNSLSNSHIWIKGGKTYINGDYVVDYKLREDEIISYLRKAFSTFSIFTVFKRLPLGSDIHYTGTATDDPSNPIKLNDDYSLVGEKNLFLIDGSALPGNPIYPGIYIINNAIDFAEKYNT